MTTAADDNVAWWNVYTPPNTYPRLSRCPAPSCIVRWPSGGDRLCSANCQRAWLAKAMKVANDSRARPLTDADIEALAAKFNNQV